MNETPSQGATGGAPEASTAPAAPTYSQDVARVIRLTQEIMRRREATLSATIVAKPKTSLYASNIPECERQGVYEFQNWQDKKLYTWELAALFEAGNNNEALYKAQLRALGFNLVEDGAPLSADMRTKYNIGGYLDTRIVWEGKRIPVEMKLTSPMIFERLKSGPEGVEIMRRFSWLRKYLRQGTVYMMGTNEPAMMFAFTDGRGAWKFPVLELDYAEAERILKIAERIKKHVEKESLPDRISYDTEICGRCPFLHVCIPDINREGGVKDLNQTNLAAMLERRADLEEKGQEFAKLDKKIKDTLKELGVVDPVVTVGDFIITSKPSPFTTYDMPDSVKAAYKKVQTVYRRTFERFLKPDAEKIYMEPKRLLSFDDE